MSVTPNQIVIYGSANMPEADSVTIGGSIDFTKRVQFADLPWVGLSGTANTDTIDLVSGTLGDTGVHVQISGRDSSGIVQTPAFVTCNGTTVVSSSFSGQRFQRLIAGVITGGSIAGLINPAGTAATSDIAVMAHNRISTGLNGSAGSVNTTGTTPPLFALHAGDGALLTGLPYQGLGVIVRITSGAGINQLRYVSVPYAAGTAGYGTDIVAVNRDWTTVPGLTSFYDLAYGFLFDITPNAVSAITRMFATSAADVPGGAQRLYYEKVFVVNTNGTTSLVTSQVQIASESGALPAGATLDLATGTGFNDNVTITNRQTAPGAGSIGGFVVQPSAINVPGNQALTFGNSAAVSLALWARLTINAGTQTYQGAADFRVTGNTT